MAIDYVVDLDCVPKQTLGTDGILARMKGRARAEAVIRLFRQHGDERPPSEMGFEFTRSTPEGAEENRVVVVQDMLDQAEELDPLEHHCIGCPANVRGEPFGCFGFIQYPISAAGEAWLMEQLPAPEEPLPWLLLRQTVTELGYGGHSVTRLRAEPTYFEEGRVLARGMGEFEVTNNQVFEMLFMLGHLQPAHAGALLLFFNAVERTGLETPQIVAMLNRALPTDELRQHYPFRHQPNPTDDQTTGEFKTFLRALWHGWSLGVRVLLDV